MIHNSKWLQLNFAFLKLNDTEGYNTWVVFIWLS